MDVLKKEDNKKSSIVWARLQCAAKNIVLRGETIGIKIECEKCESKKISIDVEIENKRIVVSCNKCGEATIVPLSVNQS